MRLRRALEGLWAIEGRGAGAELQGGAPGAPSREECRAWGVAGG